MKTILIIEDDPSIVRGLEEALTQEHYRVIAASGGEKGYTMAKRENIDLILLDLRLPDKNGEDVCRDLRKDGINTPILVLSSKKQEMDKVLLLQIGADDYVTKPFGIRELLARIQVLLRRKTEIRKDIEEYSFGNVHIDFKRLEARKGSKLLQLSAREFDTLKYFFQHEGEVISRDMLLNEVWGYEEFPTTRTVDNHILSLRKRIEDNPSKPKHLITVHSAGYKFVK